MSLSCSFQKRLLKVPALSPQFSTQDARLPSSAETSTWERSLTLGADLTATAASGLWCPTSSALHLLLFSWGPLSWQASHVPVLPPIPAWQQSTDKDRPPTPGLPQPYFQGKQWSPTGRALWVTAPPSSANLCCIHITCRACTKPECTNTTCVLSYVCSIRSALFNSGTLIHAFTFLGDINTNSYIQNEKGNSNSIEIGL